MEFRFEYDIWIVRKLAAWAEAKLTDDVDFIDYWYNLFLSQTKTFIDEPDIGNLSSFGIVRWKNDFEVYIDGYSPKKGVGFCGEERCYFATYSQYLVYELQTPSKVIAEYFGKDMFHWLMKNYRFHTIGTNLFMQYFVEKWGLPPGISNPYRVVNC